MRKKLGLSKTLGLVALFILAKGPFAQAGEKVYFRILDGEFKYYSCDRDSLECQISEKGELASLLYLKSQAGGREKIARDGETLETAFDLDIDARLFKEYVLNFIRFGRVAFKDKADAENTLTLCEHLGLPEAEDFICKSLNKAKRGECPSGYVLVPGNELYETPRSGQNFCVMKYAASKDRNGKAASKSSTAWVNINRTDAEEACRKNGENYHLITNDEWMTIARNIEANPANWNRGNGPVGTGVLPRGNSDSQRASAPSNDLNPYFGTGYEGDWTHKRTHQLSNGEILWDMAGNLWQWVADDLTIDGNGWREFTSADFAGSSETGLRLFYAPNGPYGSAQNIGAIIRGSAGATMRGGSCQTGTYTGVFAANLGKPASSTYITLGFRCTYELR